MPRVLATHTLFAVLATTIAGATPPKDWTNYYTGPAGFYNIVWDATTDDSGGIYVAGESATGTGAEFATVKYDAAGNQVWVARYLGRPNGSDRPFHVAVDPFGDVITGGQSDGVGTFLDFAAVKVDGATGAQDWVRRYDAPEHNLDSALGMALDQDGNAYLAGQSWGGTTGYDFLTVRVSTLGVVDWAKRFDGPYLDPNDNGNADAAVAIAVDSAANSYVGGWVQLAHDSDCGCNIYVYAVVKYDSSGDEIWAQVLNDEPGQAADIVVGPDGNPIVTGSVSIGWKTMKLDKDSGTILWQSYYTGPIGAGGTAYAMTIDHQGNPIVTGGICAGSPSCAESIATVKYDGQTGEELWAHTYRDSDPQTAGGSGRGLTVDCRDNVYVAGFMIFFGSPRQDAVAIMISADGQERWVDSYRPAGSRLVSGRDMAVDSTGHAILAGTRDTAPGTSSFMTVRYAALTGDLDASNCVDLNDLTVLLSAFGRDNRGDLNCDGVTDLSDLAQLLSSFGVCL